MLREKLMHDFGCSPSVFDFFEERRGGLSIAESSPDGTRIGASALEAWEDQPSLDGRWVRGVMTEERRGML